MAPEVLSRKLSYLRQLLADLAPYEDATLAQVEADHYKNDFGQFVVILSSSLDK